MGLEDLYFRKFKYAGDSTQRIALSDITCCRNNPFKDGSKAINEKQEKAETGHVC